MTNSMKDLLLGLGFKPAPKPDAGKPDVSRRDVGRRDAAKPGHKDAPRGKPADAAGQARRQDRRPEPKPAHPPRERPHAQVPRERPDVQSQRTRAEIDLGKAYAMRAQKEKDERIEAERLKQEAARIKREAKATVAELLRDKALNDASGELTRHFDYNGKIRRVHVNEAQLKSLNAGEFGVVQLDGRYLLVDAALAREVQALLPSLLALLVDPDAPPGDDPYADPKYAIPDDLVW
ncbi:MAG TPA: DUF2058 family protein [Xanthomonadaceae bacterium]|jgi:uncharacterized protein YaiL (DUF2058 family)